MSLDDFAMPTFAAPDQTERNGLSKREYAAIHLLVPNSGDPKLDAMINKARRDWFALQSLHGLCGNRSWDMHSAADLASGAFQYADAMMKESDND